MKSGPKTSGDLPNPGDPPIPGRFLGRGSAIRQLNKTSMGLYKRRNAARL
jgi:hypothetical protein